MQTIDTPAARATDPCTSHEAAEQHTASGDRAAAQQMVLGAIRRHGQGGITADELAQAAGIDRYTISRRLPELRDAGRVFVRGYPLSPERRKSTLSNRQSMVWRPVEVQ